MEDKVAIMGEEVEGVIKAVTPVVTPVEEAKPEAWEATSIWGFKWVGQLEGGMGAAFRQGAASVTDGGTPTQSR